MDTPQPKNELSEILVGGHQNGLTAIGSCEHFIVGDPGLEFPHTCDRVAVRAQALGHGRIHAFIEQQVHVGAPGTGYTTSARSVWAA